MADEKKNGKAQSDSDVATDEAAEKSGRQIDSSHSEKVWVGFDLGGTKMLTAVYDDAFKQLGRERKKTRGSEGEKYVVNRIVSSIHAAIENAGVSIENVAGIGIGCPGPIDTKRGVVIEAPNLGWKNVNIRKILGDEFKTEIAVCNDVDAGVFGEYKFGAAKKSDCAVGIFPGTGVGGGCVLDGRIFQSKRRSCMEIGHIPICSDSVMDGAGNSGTLESVASRLVIASQLALASFRGQAPALNERAGTDLSNIRSAAISEALEEDGDMVKEILVRAGEHLSSAIVTLIHLMSPDVIILGGGMVEAMPDFFVDLTRKRVSKRILQSFADTYEIKVAELGDDAAVKGSAAWVRQLTAESDK